jgi:hypothetical protein
MSGCAESVVVSLHSILLLREFKALQVFNVDLNVEVYKVLAVS